MRAYKRVTAIAKSIVKLIEEGSGTSLDIASIVVRLPPAAFDRLLVDSDRPPESLSDLRVQGILFKRAAGSGRTRTLRPRGE